MNHDPSNTNCDLTRYPGTDVICSCDDDDAPVPSTVPALENTGRPNGGRFGSSRFRDVEAGAPVSDREAALYAEMRAATRELAAAKQIWDAVRARSQAALEAWSAEISR